MSEVHDTYYDSDGDRTKQLYARLEAVGPGGIIAMNLLRAAKASERAKLYRGGDRRGSYKRQAYDKKRWSIMQLLGALRANAGTLGIEWGWGYDAKAIEYEHVLYVELPEFGQVSFHMSHRDGGEDHKKPWDGMRGLSSSRIIRFACAALGEPQPAETRGEQDAKRDRAKGAGAKGAAGIKDSERDEAQGGLDL